MSLIHLILVIALLGLLVYVVTEFIPMPPKFHKAIYIVAALILVVLILQVLGVDTGSVRIGV